MRRLPKRKVKLKSCVFLIVPLLLLVWVFFVVSTTIRLRRKGHSFHGSSSASLAYKIDPIGASFGGSIRSGNSIISSHLDTHQSIDNNKTVQTTERYARISLSTTTSSTRKTTHSPNSTATTDYWRYDQASPRVVQGRTMQLPCVPLQHRLDAVAFQNVTEYVSHAENVYPQREYYFDYNPSIVRLPVPFPFTIHSKHGAASDMVYYLASFRVSNQNYCFHPEDRQRMMATAGLDKNKNEKRPNKDWLGLALLSANLTTIIDGVVDVQQIPGFGRSAQDFRLFVLPSSNEGRSRNLDPLNAFQIYLSSNDVIVPLWIKATTTAAIQQQVAIPPLLTPPPESDAIRIPQVFGALEAWVRPYVSCASCGKKRNGMCGKNFNYFDSENNNHDEQTLVEIWPSPPHLIRAVNLTQPCQRRLEPLNEWSSSSSSSSPLAVPSFSTVEQAWFPQEPAANAEVANQMARNRQQNKLLTRGRGSACCIDITHVDDSNNQQEHKEKRRLWMGMEHSKTLPLRRDGREMIQPNHYLSRLYAFEQTPPYSIVARSGYFCLGFPSPEEQQEDDADQSGAATAGPLVQVTTWRKLVLGNPNQTTTTADASEQQVVFDCPRIHFVSGMTVDATDPSMVIISYGVNDCVSRLVRVHLDDLKQLLFEGPVL